MMTPSITCKKFFLNTLIILFIFCFGCASEDDDSSEGTFSDITLDNITSSNEDGEYGVSDSINVLLEFSGEVTVTGAPFLKVEAGGVTRVASYDSGSGSGQLVFDYQIQTGDFNADLYIVQSSDAFSLNGGSIQDSEGNNISITIPNSTGQNSLASNKDIVVDGVYPVSGGFGLISTSDYSISGYTLNWSDASDNYSEETDISYRVYRSNSDNINSVNEAESNGTSLNSFTNNLNSYAVSGLTLGSTFYYNVIARDAAGNKISYSSLVVTNTDDVAPIPGNTGTINTSGLSETGVILNWTKATDNSVSQNLLLYRIFRSTSNNISTVVNAEANGTPLNTNSTDTSSFTVSGLDPNTDYYFNIIVQDSYANKGIYQSVAIKTLDNTAPTPGGGGTIFVTEDPSDINLSWTEATDNGTSSGNFTYKVYRSAENTDNINNISDAETNGTLLSTQSNTSFSDTPFNDSNIYYYNIIVIDEAGNKAIYNSQGGDHSPCC